MNETPAVPSALPVMLIGPEEAQKFLDSQIRNRTVRQSKVKAMARDMVEGRWGFNGDPIRFDVDSGELIDGGHRLRAVVQSGTKQHFVVVALPAPVRETIDTGTPRSLADLLDFIAEEFDTGKFFSGKVMAAIVRRLVVYRGGIQTTTGGTYVPTFGECVEFARANRERLMEAHDLTYKLRVHPLPVPPSPVASAWYVCAEKDYEKANEFFDALVTGNNLHKGHPAGAFRSRAIQWQKNNTGWHTNLPGDDTFRLAITAWNIWREGRQVVKLQRPRGGWATRPPIPK